MAVVGATNNKESANYYLVPNLVNMKYNGKVYPVNPNLTELAGLKVYPNLQSIDDDVDLAVISVPAEKILGVVRDCVAKKIKHITITAGGFSEGGKEGKGYQEKLRDYLRKHGIRTIGPNALSPINTANNLAVDFGPIYHLSRGHLAFVFQSGLYQPRLNWLSHKMRLHISKLIDLGNKMDITEVDALEYLAQDTDTRVIAIHMESIAGDARRFFQILRQTTLQKPVIIIKSGRTEAGARAASSHTGAISKTSDIAFDTAIKQAGAIRASGLEEFFDLAKAFEYLPPLKGNRIAIYAFSGGEGVITVDTAQANGLVLADLNAETRKKLRAVFPPWELSVNPFDSGVSMQFHGLDKAAATAFSALGDDPNVDCFAVQVWAFSPAQEEHLVSLIIEVARRGKHVVTWVADPLEGKVIAEKLEANHIPVYPSGERAVRALGALHRYYRMHEGS